MLKSSLKSNKGRHSVFKPWWIILFSMPSVKNEISLIFRSWLFEVSQTVLIFHSTTGKFQTIFLPPLNWNTSQNRPTAKYQLLCIISELSTGAIKNTANGSN